MQKSKLRAYVFLLSTTILLVTALYLTPRLIGASLTRVKVVRVTASDVKTTVSCSGTIEAAKERTLYYANSLMVGKIQASIGETVEVGDTLFTVDKQQTQEAIANNNAGLSAGEGISSSGMTSSDYSALLQQYQGATASQNSSGGSSSSGALGTSENADIPSSVKAPISGTVTQLNVQQGSYTDPTQPVAVISQLNSLQVQAQVDEISVTSVKVGQEVQITGDGFSGTYTGHVTKIYPAARQLVTASGTRTVVDILLSLEGNVKNIKPGLTADVSIITADKPKTLTAPYEAIAQDNSNREYVFVCRGSRVFKTYIETGIEYQNVVEVLSGLREGDMVVQNPGDQLNNAQVVRAYS